MNAIGDDAGAVGLDSAESGHAGNSPVEVREVGGNKGVFAGEVIEAGTIIRLKGSVSGVPSRHSLQLDKERHLILSDATDEADDPDSFWKYLNHSCRPNGHIDTRGPSFHALRRIARGEECTFNYLTTEYEMAEPFECRCGSVDCFGVIGGYARLGAEEKLRLSAHAAPHLTDSTGGAVDGPARAFIKGHN
ncbi:MAG TPA: SET domain-containing protein-lysine N-methyltransferase [Pyrinomonadaceae bacterium]|nr:SET domain-containing protein-lysine N-methyltransferase [Pyrinomonadaceae bacterium]